MAKIRWTEEAIFWLEEIYQYIAIDNPKIAKKIVNKIYEKEKYA